MGVVATQADGPSESVQAIGALGQGTGTLENSGAVDAALADSTTWSGFPRRRDRIDLRLSRDLQCPLEYVDHLEQGHAKFIN